jgi:hypothetical protein
VLHGRIPGAAFNGAGGMDILRWIVALHIGWLVAASVAGCATPGPAPTQVVTMSARDGAAREEFPPAGVVWRLNEQELRALGPILPTPDPPPAAVAPRPEARGRSRPPWLFAPSFFYFGSRSGFGWNDPYLWPRYHRYPYPWGYAHPWH